MKTRPGRGRGLSCALGALLALAAGAGLVEAQTLTVTISNADPRYDTNGNIVDAHDGCLMQFGGKYYLYGTAYGNNTGFTYTNFYRCYSSTDLVTWKLEGNLLQNPPQGAYYRPYVIYNATTHKYVLWYNWYTSTTTWDGRYGVAIGDVPQGPFVIQNANVTLSRTATVGDLGLLVDDDGSAYLIYTSDLVSSPDHRISIEKLSADYVSSALQNSGTLGTGCEAPALFKRNGIYYALFDATCAFCPQGSGAQVWSASSPLGPYTYRGNMNGSGSNPIIRAQQTHVARLATPSGDVYLWMGDRWTSTPDGIKGHDFQYWSPPLQFDPNGNITPLQWTNQWTLQISGADATPPSLVSATAASTTQVAVLFSEPVDAASAQTASNYTLSSGATVSAAALGADTRTVTLTTSVLAPNATYTLTVTNVKDSAVPANTIAPNSQFTFTTSGLLPPPWLHQDIGSVGLMGGASYAGAAFTIKGGGDDIWNTADAFHFAYQPLNGDGTVVARVTSVQNTDSWAKAGVMIRETLTAGSTHALMAMTPGNGTSFQRRTLTGGVSTHTTPGDGAVAPYWVKLVRSGNTFNGYRSSDGVAWTLVGSDTIVMAAGVYAGLPVTAHNNTLLNTAAFDGVTVTPGPVNQPPSIAMQPASQTVTAGQNATFGVEATGTAPLSYQWRKNTVNISGATAASYSTPAATTADNGSTFSVVVSNGAGSATSNNATLTVNVAAKVPVILSTDLFHNPHADLDDQFDTAGMFAIPDFDFRGIILDNSYGLKDWPIPGGSSQFTSGGQPPVAQLNYLTGRNIPAAIGLSGPLSSPADQALGQPANVQGGVQMILDVLSASATPVTLITLGSLRDVAAAFNRNPNLLRQKVGKLVIFIGNANPAGPVEWNVNLDVQAWISVMRSGLPIYWVPCYDSSVNFGNDGNASWAKCPNSATLSNAQTDLKKYFVYAYNNLPANPLAYVDAPLDQGLFGNLVSQSKDLWCTAVLPFAAGQQYVWDGSRAITLPAGQSTSFAKYDFFDFQPVLVNVNNSGGYAYGSGSQVLRFRRLGGQATYIRDFGSVVSHLYEVFPVNRIVAPSIATQPANQTVTAGQPATFTVAATGTAPLNYQWRKGGVNIAGATAASYTTPAATFADSGSTFSVVVSNSAGSITSNNATLTVNSISGGPVAYFRLDDGAGLNAADSSGNGHAGALANGPAWTTAGKVGGALSFDGLDDQVSVPDTADLRITGDITLAFWMKKSSEALSWQRLVGKGAGNGGNPGGTRNYGVWEEYGSGKRILFQQYDSAGLPILEFFSASNVEASVWSHIACVVRGSSGYIYINGVQDATSPRTGTPVTSADPLTLGRATPGYGPGDGSSFPGLLDDVRIYNRALSAAEIATLAGKGAALKSDFDGDRKADLLFRHPSSGDVFLWLLK